MKNIYDRPQGIFYKNTSGFQSYKQNVRNKTTDFIITNTLELKDTKDYQIVADVICSLMESGISRMGEGYCVSVSDIVFNLLRQREVQCHLEEVQLSVGNGEELHMVGFETKYSKNTAEAVNTHVVVITDTEIPMLIDLAIAHRLPNDYQAIIEKAQDEGSKVLCSIQKDGTTLIYQEKLDGLSKIPQMHQISILDRMQTDQTIFDSLKSLKVLNIVGILLSSFALLNIFGKLIFDWYN
jgi:hypothetical protein